MQNKHFNFKIFKYQRFTTYLQENKIKNIFKNFNYKK